MSNLSTPQIYALNRQAGFSRPQAIIATAIAFAESAGNPTAIGDRGVPGPGAESVGLFQINYLPSRDAKVAYRDPKANLDPLTNAKSAFLISNSGKNFSPWTTFTNDAYKKYLPQATAASAIEDIKNPSIVNTWQSGAKTATTDVTKAIGKLNPTSTIERIVLTALFLVAGLGLVVLGAARATGTDKVATKAITKGIL